ncbi:sulfite exporter TauE/SafE family protein [Lysinibacillus sphaericus]|uniref:Probable membrane transporter protein n=1 Tax=Lysinibacillus sphaericus OT4b.31 TaxID=1285586 RepID=R7Z926_LYSSH|nr:TSUP family transporter [Lysinibacillus sphaericus]EON70534.1 permease [Lysinibacillus sphaericus OT4b.31]
MDINLLSLAILLFFGFIASFLNAIVGGGGLISLPALMAVGLPPSTAIATNKLANTISNGTSMLTFLRAGKVDFKKIGKVLPFIFIGSLFGAYTVHLVSPAILKPLMLVMLVLVATYTVLKKDWGHHAEHKLLTTSKKIAFIVAFAAIGFYDGFFGPGTGSFYIFLLLMMGNDFLQAAGNAKAFNFTSNLAALAMFLALGEVNFLYGLPMGFVMVFGAILGSKFALKRDTKIMRIIFIIMTCILIVKNAWDYFGPN